MQRLVRAHGGTKAYVPIRPGPSHDLCKTLGVDAVRRVRDEWGWGYVMIPLSFTSQVEARRREVLKLVEEGLSATCIARRLGVHERTVFRHRQRNRERKAED